MPILKLRRISLQVVILRLVNGPFKARVETVRTYLILVTNCALRIMRTSTLGNGFLNVLVTGSVLRHISEILLNDAGDRAVSTNGLLRLNASSRIKRM